MLQQSGWSWLVYTGLTVFFWGVYGVLIHKGAVGMNDPAHGRIKAFLFVGGAYFLIAILGSSLNLYFSGASWVFPAKASVYSLIAGVAGALGALFLLFAFGVNGKPMVVMSIVFAGAPIINALFSMIVSEQGLTKVFEMPLPFYLGIILAATGGALVSYYKG